MITYEDIATSLEEAWTTAGLHDHLVAETIQPDSMERVYRAELFPDHPEPMTDANSPPWVELTLTWTPAHQLRADGHDISPGPLDLVWTYTADVRSQPDRSDTDLFRVFNAAVRNALRRVAPEMPDTAAYLGFEMRRGYRPGTDRPALVYTQVVGTNMTDLSDLWGMRQPGMVAEALRDELIVVASLLHAIGETFGPAGSGGYRSASTA